MEQLLHRPANESPITPYHLEYSYYGPPPIVIALGSFSRPAGTGRGVVSMAGGQEGQGARKGNGVKRLRQIGAEMV